MDTHTQNDSNNPINYKETEEDRAAAKNELMRDTLQALSLEHFGEDATDFFSSIENLGDDDSDQIYDALKENGFFDVEIIYYSKAMEYLKEHDNSLSESVELATEYGYTLENINSETLASLHASRKREDDFFEYVAQELDKIYNK
tara:strand:- start:69 stop:503 length:435 start_codon:yes stop_codon:yes gene_type:complete